MSKHRKWLLPALWLLLLLPFLTAAPAAHPATDDFTFAVYTHPTWLQTGSILHVLKDALSYALRTWRDWQGTVTGVLIMTLNPAVFSLKTYGIHAVLLVLLDLTAWFVFILHFACGRLKLPRAASITGALVLTAIQLLFLPDIVEGIYWFNGAWFYTGAQAVSLLTLTLCDLAAVRTGRGKRLAEGILAAGLLFALGMDNYITAMMTLCGLGAMMLQRLWAREYRPALISGLLLGPIALGLLLSVIAPGNSVRMATDGAHQSGLSWMLSSSLWTFRDALRYFARFSLKTPLLACILAALPCAAGYFAEHGPDKKRVPAIPLTLLFGYLLLCAMIIPHMYTSGYAGSGRVINMYHDAVLLILPLAVLMVLCRLKKDTLLCLAAPKSRRVCLVLAAAAAVVCLAGGQLGNYLKLVSDQFDGTQKAYIEQFRHEYALCEAAGPEDDVALPKWTVQTMTGKSTAFEDPTVWTNESMALYFGVHSVYVESK